MTIPKITTDSARMCVQAYDEKNQKVFTMPLLLCLFIGFITIIKLQLLYCQTCPIIHILRELITSPKDEKSLYFETEMAPDTVLEAGCWQHDAESRLENAIQFFPSISSSCGALHFRREILRHSAMRKTKPRNTKITYKGPKTPRRESKSF